MPRWRAMVTARASSRRVVRSDAVFSSSPVACWKRRPKSSFLKVAICSTIY
jgi:hypothetical protein